MKTNRPTIFQILVHLGGIIPLVYLLIRYQTDNLGPNPILELEHETGKIALFFLVLSLACTPARNITGWKEFVRRRKALGLYGALYAFVHFAIFIGLDYGFDLNLVLDEAIRRNFIIVGAIALTILSGPNGHFQPVRDIHPGLQLEKAAPPGVYCIPAGYPSFCHGHERQHPHIAGKLHPSADLFRDCCPSSGYENPTHLEIDPT